MNSNDAKQYAPATERNREPILEVLLKILPREGTILEVASGTGEHALFFAPRVYPRQWIPSEANALLRQSITAWREDCPTDNLQLPLDINVESNLWSIETVEFPPIEAIVNINMIHIAPWSACLGLMAGAERILPAQGILYLYGPFRVHGQHTASSNVAFDEMLKSQNPAWGIRDLDEVIIVARQHHLRLKETINMPANNLSVVFEKIV
ncbi:MAG: DUF938 domain-containing protein [Gloeocapsa sp. DLM2.Bin57]|nr:MAG: DUF938 domain-containing protein [Gloeocapsa sp. DLM2.Bin57]